MKKTWKKILCLTLVFACLASMMVGCRKKGEVEEFTYPGQENMTMEEILELDRQNPITIKIYVADMTDVPDKNSPVLKAIAEATGTTVEIVSIASDRLQVLLATGDYPDVMVMNRNATFYDYLESGDVADIGPLLQKWAPTVYEMNSGLINLFANDKGELLYLTENNDLLREGEKHPEDATDPTRAQDELPWHSTLYVQYPLVNEIYGKAITTFDQYKEAMDAYIAKMGAQSASNKYYALSYDKDSAGDILWAGLAMYGYKCVYKGGLYVTKDGENYSYGFKTPEAKEWLLYLNELYRDGYIYTDASVQDYDKFIKQLNREQVFSFIGNYFAIYEANKTLGNKNSTTSYIPQKVMAPGVEQVYQYNAAYTGAGAFMIMNSSPYKQRIARLLEYLYSDEGSILHGWGIEGVDYVVDENGIRDITPEIAAQKGDANSKYDLNRGIRALYSIINLPTYTTDGQPAFARFAPYYSSDSGIDDRDKIIREDPVYNWHEDWKGTFYSDLSEMDIVIEGGSDAAKASAQAARIIKDHINNIIMAKSREEAIALYEKALKEFEAYGISAWEEEINRQIHAKRDKLNG